MEWRIENDFLKNLTSLRRPECQEPAILLGHPPTESDIDSEGDLLDQHEQRWYLNFTYF